MKQKSKIKLKELVEIVNSQALTIRAMIELLNLTDEQIQKKGFEIVQKMKAMPLNPYEDDEDEFDEDDEIEDSYDDSDDYEEEEFEDEAEGYDFQKLKSKIGAAGAGAHPTGAFIFGN